MKMVEAVGKVITSDNIVPSQFRIKASRKAFEILSAGLYSDKIRAIIRELSTNAADAHVAAGKADVPFEVHLPNNMEPWFAVTDFGIGLSDDAIMNVYTTYFESDKTESNDFTGCLGLGSKSPFSYTDSFTVESRHNGVKRVYSAYLSEEGMPSITKMVEDPTSEGNGLTVRFPVKSGDFHAFQSKAAETLQWFKVRPTVTGWSGFSYPERTYLRKTDKYGIRKTREYGCSSYVVMGNVAYQIQSKDLLDMYREKSGDSQLQHLLDWGVELYVNVGECDISASREKLGYDKRTVKFLKESLKDVLIDLEKEVTKDIAGKPTLWEARLALHEVRNSFDGFNFKAEWGGKPITDFVKVGYKEVEVPDEMVPGNTKKVTRAVALAETFKMKSRNGERIVVRKERAESIFADKSAIFLNDDRGAYAAVRRYLGKQNDWRTRVYLISDYDQEWLDETGIGAVAIKASTLPKPPRMVGARGSSQKAKLYEFVPAGNADNGGSNAAGFWKPAEVEMDDGGVYVEILYFNYRMKEGEATNNPSELRTPLKLLNTLEKGVTLYGIRPADKEILEKSEGDWRTLKEYVDDVVTELEPVHHADLLKAYEAKECVGGYYTKQFPFSFANQKFVPESLFGQFVARALEGKKAMENAAVKTYGDLRIWAQSSPIKDEDVRGLSNVQEAVLNKYPLLQYVDHYRTDAEFMRKVAEYVNLIDGQDDTAA